MVQGTRGDAGVFNMLLQVVRLWVVLLLSLCARRMPAIGQPGLSMLRVAPSAIVAVAADTVTDVIAYSSESLPNNL